MTESPGVQIRAAQPDDAEALAHLHLDVWEDAYTGLMPPSVFADRRADVAARVTTWEEILSASGASKVAATTWVAEDSDGLVGFVSVGPPRDNEMEHDEEVWALYVRASSWGTGLGHALLHTAVADRPAYLGCWHRTHARCASTSDRDSRAMGLKTRPTWVCTSGWFVPDGANAEIPVADP